MALQHEVRLRELAAEPMRPAGPRQGLFMGPPESIRDVWSRRELLDQLVRRQIKARYKDSVLDLFWSFAKPLARLLVYYIAIGKFLSARSRILPLSSLRPDLVAVVERHRHHRHGSSPTASTSSTSWMSGSPRSATARWSSRAATSSGTAPRDALHRLLDFAGFEIKTSMTADGHPSDATKWEMYDAAASLIDFRRADLGHYLLGHYLYVWARATRPPREGLPSFLYRSWPEGKIVEFE